MADGDGQATLAALRSALADDPGHVSSLTLMAQLAHASGSLETACSLMQRAAQHDPENAKTLYTCGALLLALDRLDEAEPPLKEAVRLDGQLAEAAVALGNLSRARGLWSDAAGWYEQALRVRPSLSEVETNLGAVKLSQGEQDAAIRHHRNAIDLKPDFDLAHHNLLLSLHYSDAIPAVDVFDAHRRWGIAAETAITPLSLMATADDPDHPIRLGFVSPDFNNHPVSQFFLSYLLGRKGGVGSVTLYSASAKKDQITKALMENCDTFRQVEKLTDADLAKTVRDDRIDILVDLSGHTAGTRIKAFAFQPAPVQATWIGYPDTTGLSRVGYRLTDDVADPAGEADGLATETLIRLPGGFLCYHPSDDAPDVMEKPVDGRPVTFASFNNLSKVTADAVALWAEILSRVPDSRLMIKARSLNDDPTCDRLLNRFVGLGIAPDRIDIRRHTVGMAAHYGTFNDVDIALDTFPYNGTTTTCDALWMGVPVVSLLGDRHAGRVSASFLKRLDLDDWIAASPKNYVDIAVSAASNRDGLSVLQRSLRARMAASSLVDCESFAKNIDAAFRTMWRMACTD
ncbi:MAG: hypothetical protein RIM72_08100 [Alphaproteobacteria bacterium]